jgi:hypothetical protein
MRLWVSSAVIVLIVVVGIVLFFDAGQHWVALHTGTVPVVCGKSGPCTVQPWYNFWSGFGSDLGEVTLITAIGTPVVVAARHRNCSTRGCYRLTNHTVTHPDTGVAYRRCHVHHPGIPDDHSNHGIFRNHMSDEFLADLDARTQEANP